MKKEISNNQETANSDLGAVRRSALSWWNKLTNWEKEYYEQKMFGCGEWWEDNSLHEDDIIKMFQHYA